MEQHERGKEENLEHTKWTNKEIAFRIKNQQPNSNLKANRKSEAWQQKRTEIMIEFFP